MMFDDLHIIRKEIDNAICDLRLDLSGLVILTEAASNLFVLSPLIAAVAGAKDVYALIKSSKYGSHLQIIEHAQKVAKGLGVALAPIHFLQAEEFTAHSEVDIVCNLGHVRPINNEFIDKLKSGAVISYMCEAWEFRPADLDLNSCKKRKIGVYGVNEEHSLVNCFVEAGLLALKMILSSQISLIGSKIAILSRDKFGLSIFKALRPFAKSLVLISEFSNINNQIDNLDILITADYLFEKEVVGECGLVSPSLLKKLSPNVKIIQFCNKNNIDEIKSSCLSVLPAVQLEPHRMSETLADISYRALVRLHTGGLKAGEINFTKDNAIGLDFRQELF
jgi:hypothetical protein